MGTAIKHPVPDWVKQAVICNFRQLCRHGSSGRQRVNKWLGCRCECYLRWVF